MEIKEFKQEFFNNKKNIILIGMPGCGKSTIGKKLADELKLPFCDVDEFIEEKSGLAIPQIFKKGEEHFRDIESDAVRQVASNYPAVISTGGGVVKRKENINTLKDSGIIIFINRPLDNIIKDINTETRPLVKNNLSAIYRLYEERLPLYKEYCDIEVLNDKELEYTVDSIISCCCDL